MPVKVGPISPTDSPAKEAVPKEEIELALKRLDDPQFEVRNTAAKRLELFGKLAVESLQEAAESGSLEQRRTAKRILESLSVQPDLAADIECGRLLNWYEQNRAKLNWNEQADKHQLSD